MPLTRSCWLTPFATEHTLGIGGDLHVWNVRLAAILHRPDLHFVPVNPIWGERGKSIGAESYRIERYLGDDDPFDMDPPTLATGKTFDECWDALIDVLEHDCPAGGGCAAGDAAVPFPAACAVRATAPPQGPETAPPGHTCRTAPHASTKPAAGGHGRPGRTFEQMEMF